MSDKPATMAELEALITKMMSGIALSDEAKDMGTQLNERMTEVNDHIKECEKKIVSVEATGKTHSDQIPDLRRENVIMKATPRAQSSAAAPQPPEEGLRPRIVHVQGWAPYGCSATQKLNKKESMESRSEIDKRLSE